MNFLFDLFVAWYKMILAGYNLNGHSGVPEEARNASASICL